MPLCRGHHREVHRYGDEAEWWSNAGVDPTITARALWLETHPLPAISDTMVKARLPQPPDSTDQRNGKGDPPASKLASNSTTKAIRRFDRPQGPPIDALTLCILKDT